MFQGILGVVAFIGFGYLISEHRKAIAWRAIVAGLTVQVLLAALLLKVPVFKSIFMALNEVVLMLDKATSAGTSFVFGYLGGGALPFTEPFPGSAFILAFKALPLVLVVSALSSLLFYWRVIPAVVGLFSKALTKLMGIGGALGLGAAANIFVGMVEAPLFIRPYLERMTRSEIFTIMTCGMATIAGTVMVLYANILTPIMPDAMGHMLTASIISAPASILVAILLIPETEPTTQGDLIDPMPATSAMDAVTRGTTSGLGLLLNIIAMLVVLIALVELANLILALLPNIEGSPLSLQRVLGWIMAPVVWLMGVPWQEAHTAGMLMGTKTVLNEFIAYLDMGKLAPGSLSERSKIIMTYAMCGFANLGSLGIMLGGLCTMAPGRREEIVNLGGKSILAGTMATCLTGAIVGILYT
ncbi:MAG: nucleoside:proton symporter [Deltaproteobacteria bacterium]|jgi:concentrative nucleoside transporter, CNT family|nr:nucleoside:proton symporter [Deltaproteobacteria bacterium]MBT6436171.1 nucleoside:proton symporter [Deltaproteobacteria bacterium]